jgi:hypothetical protein
VAATLGAERIASDAGLLERALRAGPPRPDLLAGMASEMRAISEGFVALQAALAPAGAGEAAAAGPEGSKAV